MKWKKLGKIFDPTEHKLANNCTEFTQSPQALVFDDFVRIYFSTREKDRTGKYLSHISFIDIKKDLKTIINISKQTVIPLGNLGCFDEHGIFPMNVLKDGNRILAYTGGWSRRVSVSIETSIGLAMSSNNGLTFQKFGNGPILTSSLNESFLVGDPFVRKFNNTYHMWYIYGTKWVKHSNEISPERVYKIGHATSKDNILWVKENRQLITDKLDSDECQALPTVIDFENKYHMFFCYRRATDFRKNKNRSYRIGYAYSKNLINWVRRDNNVGIDVSEKGWDSEMVCYPHVFRCDNKVYMLYNGNEFGRFGFGLAVLNSQKNHKIDIFYMKKFDPNRNEKKIVYRIETATNGEIRDHLLKCNDDFLPLLSERVNIDEYAKKIFEKSVTFEAWSDNFLVGLVAAYFNDDEHKVGFISDVSLVKDYVGMGIASELTNQCIKYAKQHDFKEIKLEVYKDNNSAIHLYKKFGFKNSGKKGNNMSMKLINF